MTHRWGAPQRYKLALDGGRGLTAYYKKTETRCKVAFSERAGRYVIHHGDGTKWYMTKGEVADHIRLRDHFASQDLDVRPNVESTIIIYGHGRNAKEDQGRLFELGSAQKNSLGKKGLGK